MLAINRAGTIKIILVLFYETSVHTEKKFFAKLFYLVVCSYSQSAFYKVLKAMCSHI